MLLWLARVGADRGAAGGDFGFAWVLAVPALIGGLVAVWAGIRVASFSLPFGVVVMVVGGITVALVARVMRSTSAAVAAFQTGDLPDPWLNYIVWATIGLPLLFGSLLVLMAIAGRLNGP